MTAQPVGDGDDWQVVLDKRGHPALWREFLRLPIGWRIVFSAPTREAAQDYIDHFAGLGPTWAA